MSQADLRDFAWTLDDLPAKRAQLSHAAHLHGESSLVAVFCFQTALASILWSMIAYRFLCALHPTMFVRPRAEFCLSARLVLSSSPTDIGLSLMCTQRRGCSGAGWQ